MESGRNAEDDRALNLCLHGVGIDDDAAIHGAGDAPDANFAALRHFNLGDLRHIASEYEL
jgi:hypothetical protein